MDNNEDITQVLDSLDQALFQLIKTRTRLASIVKRAQVDDVRGHISLYKKSDFSVCHLHVDNQNIPVQHIKYAINVPAFSTFPAMIIHFNSSTDTISTFLISSTLSLSCSYSPLTRFLPLKI